MKVMNREIPPVLIASVIAVMALVISQLIWMRHSQQLSDQLFSQRVSMALCSAVERYDDGALCRNGCLATQQGTITIRHISGQIPTTLTSSPKFREELDKSLRFHGIDAVYELAVYPSRRQGPAVCQSPVTLPDAQGQAAFLTLTFPDKDAFILNGMSFMLVTTLLILAFITTVLLLVNWSLIRQKRLLQTNIDFFNNMAHEFRTPLSSIGLAASMLGKRHPELRDNQLVAVIRRENTHLLTEVERVLHLASIENGDYVLQKESVPVKQLIQTAISSLSMAIAEQQATVCTDQLTDLHITGDRQHLVSVFRNILDNALKYTTGQPQISIAARPHEQGVLISFQDNGIGIPKEQRELIFEKFQRAHTGDQQPRKGFGLGLAYVKRMVELHKGHICVSSELNKGSRFDIILPAV
ncbi:sensor histidine kinase [Arsenicibacter rosenii]|nr:HAMP domain-containing sensor histidine kinase [Arsenicibacter rosenii]